MATLFCRKLFADSRIHKWDRGISDHLRCVHIGERPHKCNVCDKKFCKNTDLRKHLRAPHALVLSGKGVDRSWTCSVCNAVLVTTSSLREHIGRHERMPPYKCEVCGAGFLKRDQMSLHSLIHSDVRPHKCNLCVASFKRLQFLITDRD